MSLFGGRREDDGSAPRTPAPAAPHPEPRRHTQKEAIGGKNMANIGKSISIKGDLTGNEDISIEGKVEGKVDLPNGQLTIGANGTVKGEVNAKGVVVIGRVTGNVNGSERVEIQATGVVEGDVIAPKLQVAEGAQLNGSIQMTRPGAGASAQPSSSSEPRKATA
jgi:cytoskeletal protein CcmA (bactofilin family)